jgi:hypothetical protein
VSPKVCHSSSRRSGLCSGESQGVPQLISVLRSVCSVEPQGVPQLISALRSVCSVESQGVPQLISVLRSVCSVEPQGVPVLCSVCRSVCQTQHHYSSSCIDCDMCCGMHLGEGARKELNLSYNFSRITV